MEFIFGLSFNRAQGKLTILPVEGVSHEHQAFVEVISCQRISLKWENGRVYNIDRVTDVRMAAALKAGQGMRYTCKIQGKIVYLFCDIGVWFIEK